MARAVPFTNGELPYIKAHALRALCGLLMDAHSSCTTCPFCGTPEDTGGVMQLIVHATAQYVGIGPGTVIERSAETSLPGPVVLALYFCRAKFPWERWEQAYPMGREVEPREWAVFVDYADEVPSRKAVVQLLDDGTYHAEYGPIANPTPGDYSTGALDRDADRLIYWCDPEPTHTQWRYWDSEVTQGQEIVPEFACMRLRGEWWVFDRDTDRGLYQQVAALTVADSPRHQARLYQ